MSANHIKTALAVVAFAGFGRTARADVPRCASADADLHYNNTVLAEMSGDTGWVPADSVAQLRLTGRIAGETTVAMGLAPTVCWPAAVEVSAPGRPTTGLLDFAYGGELHLFGQIHTTVLGQAIDWSGEIPVPLLPTDLMLAHTTTFDPTVLPGAPAALVAGSDTTSPIKVLGTDLIGDYIAITGISGGLQVYVTGAMTTSYHTTQLGVGAASITEADGRAPIDPPPGGFGSALDLPVTGQGIVSYAPSLIFSLAFDVKIFGIRVVNLTLASVTMPLPAIDQPIVFDAAAAHVGLPEAAPLAGARVDFATGPTQSLPIANLGEAPLVIEADAPPPGIVVMPTTIAPGQTGDLTISATSDAFAAGSLTLVLATNDPGQPAASITLGHDVGGTTLATGTPADAGCHAGHATGLPVGLALLILALRRRVSTGTRASRRGRACDRWRR